MHHIFPGGDLNLISCGSDPRFVRVFFLSPGCSHTNLIIISISLKVLKKTTSLSGCREVDLSLVWQIKGEAERTELYLFRSLGSLSSPALMSDAPLDYVHTFNLLVHLCSTVLKTR